MQKSFLEKAADYIQNNFTILLISLGLAVSSFMVDYATLPKGYELPKVYFWQLLSFVIIVMTTTNYFLDSLRNNKLKISKDFILLLIIIALFITSTIFSFEPQISLFGNQFREQGLITYILIIGLSYITFKKTKPEGWHMIALAIIISAVVQAILGIQQFRSLAAINPDSILEGIWVNGTFGQANFYSGYLLAGIIFASYYLNITKRNIFRVLMRLIMIPAIITMLIALIFSQSTWGIITAGIVIFFIILYELFESKYYPWIFYSLIILGGTILTYLLNNLHEYNIRIDIWQNIILLMTYGLNDIGNYIHLGIGNGFDTLGDFFRLNGRFRGLYIDRAHNIFLDTLYQSGAVVFFIFLGLIFYLIFKLKSNWNNRKYVFTFYAMFFWLFKSFIHEVGIVNIVEFLIVFAVCFALLRKPDLHSLDGFDAK